MFRKTLNGLLAIVWMLLCISGASPAQAETPQFKVLVVMSYHDTMPWVVDIKAGTDAALSKNCDLRYFYMDTRNNFEGGKAKAEEAYELYKEFQPDGVIVADDNAQSMFVLPYLKDKVKTPVMFCGVNAAPEKYGYPAKNVSGILERIHFAESIAFMCQLVPSVKRIGYLMGENKTARGYYDQAQSELETYPAESAGFKFPKTLDEAVRMTKDFRGKCDALFIENMIGIKDKDGNTMNEEQVIPILSKAFGKPTMGANSFIVKYGLLCAVVKTGQEQGETASHMLMDAMKGKPVSEIPITKNQRGNPIINVTVMKDLGIKPNPRILHTAELVTKEK